MTLPRLLLMLTVGYTGCGFAGCTTGPHDSTREVIGQDECATCHIRDYENTALVGLMPICSTMRPDHPATVADQNCVNCHTEFDWCPALEPGTHPDECFPRQGSHDVACLNCHDPSIGASANGRNATCTSAGCHSFQGEAGEHGDVPNYRLAYDASIAPEFNVGFNPRQNFCVSCHWRGEEDTQSEEVQRDGSPDCPTP